MSHAVADQIVKATCMYIYMYIIHYYTHIDVNTRCSIIVLAWSCCPSVATVPPFGQPLKVHAKPYKLKSCEALSLRLTSSKPRNQSNQPVWLHQRTDSRARARAQAFFKGSHIWMMLGSRWDSSLTYTVSHHAEPKRGGLPVESAQGELIPFRRR